METDENTEEPRNNERLQLGHKSEGATLFMSLGFRWRVDNDIYQVSRPRRKRRRTSTTTKTEMAPAAAAEFLSCLSLLSYLPFLPPHNQFDMLHDGDAA